MTHVHIASRDHRRRLIATAAADTDTIVEQFEGAGDNVALFRDGTSYWLCYHMGSGHYGSFEIQDDTIDVLRYCEVRILNHSVNQDDGGVTLTGSWSNTNSAGAYGGNCQKTSTAGDTATYTTPAATIHVGARIPKFTNGGFTKCYIDNDTTLCTSLWTAQQYVDAGLLASTALVANGGNLNPTDRIYDGYGGTPVMLDDVALLALDLTPAAYTVKLECTGYKRAASSDDRTYLSGFAWVTSTITAAADAEATWRTHRLMSAGSVWDYVWSLAAGGGGAQLIGNGHGNDVQSSIVYKVDGVTKTPADGAVVFGSTSAQCTRASYLRHPSTGATNLCEVTMDWVADPTKGLRSLKTFDWLADCTASNWSYMGMMALNSLIDVGSNSAADADVNLTDDDDSFKVDEQGLYCYAWDTDGDIAVLHHLPDASHINTWSGVASRYHTWQDRADGIDKVYLTGLPGTYENGNSNYVETQYRIQRFPDGANAALART